MNIATLRTLEKPIDYFESAYNAIIDEHKLRNDRQKMLGKIYLFFKAAV